MKIAFYLMILLVIFAIGCAQVPEEQTDVDVEPIATEPIMRCPASCNDNIKCTKDECSPETKYECKNTLMANCCGNGDCEEGEDFITCGADCVGPEIADEILEFKKTAAAKVKDLTYTYLGPLNAAGISYWVKGDKIKMDFTERMLYNNTRFNIIYLDMATDTAYSYCDDPGKCGLAETHQLPKRVYSKYIPYTPLDKLNDINNGEILASKETVDGKETTIILTTNKDMKPEKVWIWEYYGLPVKFALLDADGDILESTEYRGLVVSTIKEDDITVPTT